MEIWNGRPSFSTFRLTAISLVAHKLALKRPPFELSALSLELFIFVVFRYDLSAYAMKCPPGAMNCLSCEALAKQDRFPPCRPLELRNA
jgi:hypothetical protein